MTRISTTWTKEKLRDPVIRVITRAIASAVVALSGVILYTDKVATFQLENNYGFADTQTFIWVFSQTLSPILIILGANLRPYRIAYLIPIYLYSVQTYWIFRPGVFFDDIYLQAYSIGLTIGFTLLIVIINKLFRKAEETKNVKSSFIEEALDLSIQLHKRDKEDG